MTEKLYEIDPFLREFTAQVLSCEKTGDGWAVVLDRTAFYPEGGGQSADHGTLGAAAVTDVQERDGVVVHTCGQALPVGARVAGAIDWARRFDHMQQHSGEHIVSGLICARYHCDNVGFHMGHDLVTIDFNADIDPAELPGLEAAANAYIWGDAPVEIRLLSGEELERAQFRSKKFIPGPVRLVAFPGADCCACCGTHVLRAGQVGLVKLLSCQKFRQGVRIEMVCGGRAVRYASAVLEQNTRISRALSVKPLETAGAVERLQEQLYDRNGRLKALEEKECLRRAQELSGAGDVLLLEGEMYADSVRRLCDAVLDTCGGRCAVFAGENGSYQYAIGVRQGDIRPLVARLNAALDGRGGGKPAFAQGRVRAGEPEIRSFFQTEA